MQIIVHTDGGARGNPGPAAVGVVIEIYKSTNDQSSNDRNKAVIEISKRIGETTNNVAEYSAVVEALERIMNDELRIKEKDKNQIHIHFFLDSNLVVNQLNGVFKIKDASLRGLASKVKTLERDIGGEVTYLYVPREKNQRADFLVNRALDETRVNL